MNTYNLIYIFSNLLLVYTIYNYIHIFYEEKRTSILLEKLAYIGYFIIITFTHLFFKIPLIVMASNLILLFLLSLLYEGTLKKSILAVNTIYFSLMIIETLFAFLTGYLNLNLLHSFQYPSIFGLIVIRIASFVLVLLMKGFQNVKNEIYIPNIYWTSLFTILIATVLLLFTIFMNPDIPSILIIISVISALVINLVTFYLYDKICFLLTRQMQERVTEAQTKFYEEQVQMMKTTLEHIRMIRHDLKNKISPLLVFAQTGQTEELLKQIPELISLCNTQNEFAKSGNLAIDIIVNYKLHEAHNNHIVVSTDILIPDELDIPDFDISVILGNLLDNALEAVMQIDDRWIDLKIKFVKGCLLLEIKNSYNGRLLKNAAGFVSLKEDKENHGLGLKSVQATLDKYDGAMQFTYDSCKFSVKVLFYI